MINKPIILYCGINEHGRGLVDAMSGFGVKTPLRRAIVTDNFYCTTNVEPVPFLKTFHADDQQKYFKHLSSDDIEATCKEKGDGIKIAGCSKSHLILLFPEGSWQVKRHISSCHFCKLGKFYDCVGELANHVISDKEINNDDLDLLDEEYNSEMHMFVVENSYVALQHKSPKSLELFYLLKVWKKVLQMIKLIFTVIQ